MLCLLLTMSVAAAGAAPAPPLAPYEAMFKVRQGILSGRLTQRLEETEEGLKGQSIVEAAGLIGIFVGGELTEESWMTLGDDGVRSRRFRSRDNISNDRHDIDAAVDWAAREVHVRMDDDEFTLPFEGELQDRMSMQFYLMDALARGERPEQLQLLHEDEIRRLDISYLAEREVETPTGTFRVIGVRHSKPRSDRVTTFWSAPELGYLPVVIEQEKRGKKKWYAELEEHGYLTAPETSEPAAAGD